MGKGPIRHEHLTWEDVDQLIDMLLDQLKTQQTFDEAILITRGGIIPGGMLCEALDIKSVLTASVDFHDSGIGEGKLAAWPNFLQFPNESLLRGKRILTIDDVWGSGRTSTAVRGRAEAAGGKVSTCVLHFNPYRSLFTKAKPDFYGAITDAWIVYPWEIDRGPDRTRQSEFN